MKNKPGFTLIELLLAIAVLITALCGLLLLFNYCYALTIQAGNITFATAEAYGMLEEIRAQDYADIMNDYNGDVFNMQQPVGNGIININFIPGTNNELLQATVTVNWQERGNRALQLIITTLITER